MKTKQDITVRGLYGEYNVPKGTEIIEVKASGSHFYAVASQADAIKCGMSAHDAKYRYLYVPKDAVDEN